MFKNTNILHTNSYVLRHQKQVLRKNIKRHLFRKDVFYINLNVRSVKPSRLYSLFLFFKNNDMINATIIKTSPSVNAPWNPDVKPFNFSTGSIGFAELSI